MQGIKRRIVYLTIYEGIAIALTSVALGWLGHGPAASGVAAVAASTIALIWNFVWNSAFEWWEARQTQKGRSIKRRVAHAIGFEGGLVLFIVPMFAWWLNISWWDALVLDAWLIVFFLIYTFVFNWIFDRIFGLPASAQPAG